MKEKKKRYYRPPLPCPKNENVRYVHIGRCDKCGWNPDVAKARTEKFIKQFKEVIK